MQRAVKGCIENIESTCKQVVLKVVVSPTGFPLLWGNFWPSSSMLLQKSRPPRLPSMSSDRRRKGFKKGIDTEDARRKRETNIVELRKNKRDENLQKKRAIFGAPGAASMEDSNRGTASFQRKVCHCMLAQRPAGGRLPGYDP